MPEFPPDVPLSPSLGAALAAMVDRDVLASRKYQEQQWRASRLGAHPDLLEFERTLVGRLARLGVPMFAAEVLRTPERQNELHRLGHSRARAGSSAHQFGLAADIVHSVKAWGLDRKQWLLVGHMGKEVSVAKGIPVEWGGDWKFYDPAHWELAQWRTLKGGHPWPTM